MKLVSNEKPDIKAYYAIRIDNMIRQPGIKHFFKFWWGADVWVNGIPLLKVTFVLNALAIWLLK